jgi:uroporphyrinogen-III synthase
MLTLGHRAHNGVQLFVTQPAHSSQDQQIEREPTLSDSPGAPIRGPDRAALAGYTVAIASDRRRHRLADLLESVGARTIGIQAARSVATLDESALRAATARCLADGCDEVVISSAVGLRAWIAAARRWGLAERLVTRFAGARLLARDAPAADSLRALGLTGIYSTDGGTTEELLRYLLAQPLRGRRVVVETNRISVAEACAALRHGGAEVIEAPTHTASPPVESYSSRRLCDLVIRRHVDALALVGAPVAQQLTTHAAHEGRLAALVSALAEDVLCTSLGPLPDCAPVRPLVADRPFPEELAQTLLVTLPPRALNVVAAGHQLELRGHAVVIDGQLVPVQPGPLAILRALAQHPGQVLSSAELRAMIGQHGHVDDHAVEMAVSRLRQSLRGVNLVQTIVKHGYMLAQ